MSPDKDDSPTLEIVPFGSQEGGRGEGRGDKREVVTSIIFTSFARMSGGVIISFFCNFRYLDIFFFLLFKKQFFHSFFLGCDWSERQALGALGTTLAGQDDQV